MLLVCLRQINRSFKALSCRAVTQKNTNLNFGSATDFKACKYIASLRNGYFVTEDYVKKIIIGSA